MMLSVGAVLKYKLKTPPPPPSRSPNDISL